MAIRRRAGSAVVAATALLVTACSAGPPSGAPRSAGASGSTAAASSGASPITGVPRLRVRVLASGFDHVWDVQRAGAAGWLFTERDRAELHLLRRGRVTDVSFPSDSVWVSGETGLMSLAVDPDFATSRRFYTCQGGFTPTGHDVRVMAWRLSDDGLRAEDGAELLGGLPTTSGRHGGCRLLVDRRTGALIVGTGDAADEANAHQLDSLGGKVLRLDRFSGQPWPDNPFAGSDGAARYVYTYGHRNVQGLAQRADGSVWSAEHGPDRDDEVNLLEPGGDYGWNPGPGYDESVPMTDQALPGAQVEARWSTGLPTLALSGAAFVHGRDWGALEGTLAVAALKAGRVVFLRFDEQGRFVDAVEPVELQHYGRLRSVTATAAGGLLVTTDNGGADSVLLVTARSA